MPSGRNGQVPPFFLRSTSAPQFLRKPIHPDALGPDNLYRFRSDSRRMWRRGGARKVFDQVVRLSESLEKDTRDWHEGMLNCEDIIDGNWYCWLSTDTDCIPEAITLPLIDFYRRYPA
ncbi:hypothetical protein CLCR_02162 [Cladophialophora carrionii]|uniref:Uncharacterized protein n=1 Tax=Cladophialophora carrionii TaxID=86049 RepID=A0A1C1CE19_9EURO|nr:hypothetical protein CLCR_02162 [Cladophialophora carrionii]